MQHILWVLHKKGKRFLSKRSSVLFDYLSHFFHFFFTLYTVFSFLSHFLQGKLILYFVVVFCAKKYVLTSAIPAYPMCRFTISPLRVHLQPSAPIDFLLKTGYYGSICGGSRPASPNEGVL
ncbi:hypothetical protein SUBVAR_06385 [Subdoligranulum variabile DSM 15176]|uniref:Uncharacterized protein n=1 Tax=Subdoligranulum variabile DSM 15176 TaxID=411471 RepID=D1PPR8_9FIRM|nr:hypothetical protein SUBVAR_06385 [Subdoligranulum variabile DSM 15176]